MKENDKLSELRKENRQREKTLTKESCSIIEKSVNYLYRKKADDDAVEYVKKDLIEMLLDGEARGMGAEQILGDYKEVCSEILKAVPQLSEDRSWRKNAGTYFVLLPFIGMIDMIMRLFFLIQKGAAWSLENALISCAAFVIYTIIAVVVYCITRKRLDFYVTWLRGKKRYAAAAVVVLAAAMQIAYYIVGR